MIELLIVQFYNGIIDLSTSFIFNGFMVIFCFYDLLEHAFINQMANKKNVWSAQEEEVLFSSHAAMGSKWAAIANLLPGKDQCSIKNKFYSTLRRGHRKINSYITEIKRKSDPTRNRACKTIDDIFISKLIAVVDQSYEEKYEVKPAALTLAASIERNLIDMALSDFQYMKQSKDNYNMEERLLDNILEFNKSCKRRKGKRGKSDKKKNDKNEEEIEESEMIPQSKHDEIKLQQKSYQINVMTEEQLGVKKSEGEELVVQFSSFLNNLQRKESTSTIINNFSSLASEFIKNYEYFPLQEEVNLIQSANNMTHSGCLKQERPAWMYDSTSSRRSLPKRLPNYLTEPSPFPNDPYSPFTFSNIMKNKNITGSNMFQDKISCNEEEMVASASYQKDPLGSFINLLPMARSKTGEFLIKSADLKRQINQESSTLSSSMKLQKQASTYSNLFPNINQMHFANIHSRSFASQYAFEPTTVPNQTESSQLATSSESPQEKNCQ